MASRGTAGHRPAALLEIRESFFSLFSMFALTERAAHTGIDMAHWLLKTEPDCYRWDDLARDKRTVWDGVSNALALKHIRAMKKGDDALIYHTGDERAAIGIAEVVSNPYVDPKESDEKLVVVDLKPRQKLARAVTLSDIKADPAFEGWDLLRISRLSVVPVPDAMWDRVIELSKEEE